MRELIAPLTHEVPAEGWWARYRAHLAGFLTETALAVTEADSRLIAERCILPVGDPRWPDSRVRKGLVMGAVQSGKTASMIGVAALALDSGIDMVVVLSGTRLALWQQTFQRLSAQLDLPGESVAKRGERLWLPPQAEDLSIEFADSSSAYTMRQQQVARVMGRRKPIIVTAMKQVDHLRQLSKQIRSSVVPVLEDRHAPFHMLVIDDEADDGSILDARVEGADSAEMKQIPRFIHDLWDSRPRSGSTMHERLYATYMAYTATPQANFLQESFNPLAPTNFVAALRTPGAVGSIQLRQPSYAEPEGLDKWYMGGGAFYGDLLAGQSLCLTPDPDLSDSDALKAAVRAFLVAAAVRLIRSGRVGHWSGESIRYQSRREANESAAEPSCMLVHPSAMKQRHFEVASLLLGWGADDETSSGRDRYEAGERSLPAAVLGDLDHAPQEWEQWLEAYRQSAAAVAALGTGMGPVREVSDWALVRDVIRDEIIPAVRVAVINSDPQADDRPRFGAVRRDDGWAQAPDSCTIFVSGSVMSRGLTLEGLLTTYFSRRSEDPLADTQMQMQRWFGYRGSYIDLCRVFMSEEQRQLFAAYHHEDLALRREVLRLMEAREEPDPTVLQGLDHRATGKIARVHSAPLVSGPHPFFPLVEPADDSSALAARLAELFAEPFREVVSRGTLQGLLLERELTLDEAADLIELSRFPSYEPGLASWQGKRWRSVEMRLGLTPGDGSAPLYRPPSVDQGDEPLSGCPYETAAYLRTWQACLTRHAEGMYPTDDARTPWSQLDLAERRASQPTFRIALRLGRGAPASSGPLLGIPQRLTMSVRTITPDGQVVGGWGAHNPDPVHATGDEYFDQIALGEPTPVISPHERHPWRPRGSAGQLLFYVVETPSGPGLVLGASIPLGGPNQFAAYVPGQDQP